MHWKQGVIQSTSNNQVNVFPNKYGSEINYIDRKVFDAGKYPLGKTKYKSMAVWRNILSLP